LRDCSDILHKFGFIFILVSTFFIFKSNQ
jgi:hypothetical protein